MDNDINESEAVPPATVELDSNSIVNRKRKAHAIETTSGENPSNDFSGNLTQEESKANSTPSSITVSFTTGFSAYAKTNPFLAATSSGSNGKGFGFGFGSATVSVPSSSGFGAFGSGFSSESPASALTEEPPKNPKGLSIAVPAEIMPSHTSSVGRQNFNMPPPLVVPSPKSPKPNPFSSPSPVHNPFMTIVESKDELWKTMAKDKLSDEEAAKSSALLFGTAASATKKSRLANYGGSNSYFGDCGYSYNEDEKKSDESKYEDKVNEDEDEGKEDDDNREDENDEVACEMSPGKVYTTYALPENVVVVTGEEDDECLFQTRVKLYRLGVKTENIATSSADANLDKGTDEAKTDSKLDVNAAEWIEVGVGPLKVLRQKEKDVKENGTDDQEGNTEIDRDIESRDKNRVARLVIRREDKKGGIGTKLLMNTRLNQYVSIAKQSDKMIRLICVNAADPSLQLGGNQKLNQLNTYLIRTKSTKDFDDIMQSLDDLIKTSK